MLRKQEKESEGIDMSPFKSKSQRRWMHANKPQMAKKWELESSSPGELPEKVKKKRKNRK